MNIPTAVRPETILVFVDETYLHKKSGKIQAAIPIPVSGELVMAQALGSYERRARGALPKEFKGSNITDGNAEHFRQFLKYYVNGIGIQSEEGAKQGWALSPIITLVGTDIPPKDLWMKVFRPLEGALAQNGLHVPQDVLTEISKQILWIAYFFRFICPRQVKNQFSFIYDESSDFAEACRNTQWASGNAGIAITVQTVEVLTWCMNIVMQQFRKTLPTKPWLPFIGSFSFEDSSRYLGLQAADVFANLYFNSLRYHRGIRNSTVTRKNALLSEFLLDTSVPMAEVLNHIRVEGNNIVLAKPDLIARVVLEHAERKP